MVDFFFAFISLSFSLPLSAFISILQLQSFRATDPVDMYSIEEITDLFIEAGVHVDAVNVEGLTAAQICTARKLFAVVFFCFFVSFAFTCLFVAFGTNVCSFERRSSFFTSLFALVLPFRC